MRVTANPGAWDENCDLSMDEENYSTLQHGISST